MTYESRLIKKAVILNGKPIYDESVTYVEINDEAAGEFIVLNQGDNVIKIDGDEWLTLRATIDEMVAILRDNEGKPYGKNEFSIDS